jgi:hypothetical protein
MEAARFKVGLFRSVAQQGDFGGKAKVTVNVFFDSPAPRSGRRTYSFLPTTVSAEPLERTVSESKR